MKLKEISIEEKNNLLEEIKKYRVLLDYYNSLLSFFLIQNKYYESYDGLNNNMKNIQYQLIGNDICVSVFNLLSSNYTLNEVSEKKAENIYKDELNKILKKIISTCMYDNNHLDYSSFGIINNGLLVKICSEIEKELKDNELVDELRNFDKALLRSSELLSLSKDRIFQEFNKCNFSDVFYWNFRNYCYTFHNKLIDYLQEKKEQGELTNEQYDEFITEFIIQLLEAIPKIKRMDLTNHYYFIDFILETIAGKVTDDDYEKYGVKVDGRFESKKTCLRFKALDTIICRFAKKDDFELQDFFSVIFMFFSDIVPDNNSSFALYAIERAEELGEDYNSPIFQLFYMDCVAIDDNIKDWILHYYTNYSSERYFIEYLLKNRKDFYSDVVQNLFHQIKLIKESEKTKKGEEYTKKIN